MRYNIYRGGPAGEPVDWGLAVAQETTLAYVTDPIAPGEARIYAVRALDEATGQEETGTAARVYVARDAAGNDASNPPGGPMGLAASPGPEGAVAVAWSYAGNPQRPDPTSWSIWATPGTTVDYAAAPAATVPFSSALRSYRTIVAGLVDGQPYAVGVRGILSGISDGNVLVARTTAASLPCPAPERLAGVATFLEP